MTIRNMTKSVNRESAIRIKKGKASSKDRVVSSFSGFKITIAILDIRLVLILIQASYIAHT